MNICTLMMTLMHTAKCTPFIKLYSTLPKKLPELKSTIGLEVHAQISAKTKLFSLAETGFGKPANVNVNLLDAAIPGALPVLNKKCVELAVLTSLALSCKINPLSFFDRKHYFYADLPSGYQITQQRSPIASNGFLDFYVYTPGVHKQPYRRRCRLKQIQIEQDSGKSLHDDTRGVSLIDLNRAGMGLMEFVFEPDLADGEEAAALVKELVLILQSLDACSCKMEEGALRVDANVSLSADPNRLGVRTEIKNIGSTRGVANAIKYEIERQKKMIANGQIIVNETRSWNPQSKETIGMRDKKEEHDYRFMPEPNIPPVRVCVEGTTQVPNGTLDLRFLSQSIPPLPEAQRSALIEKYSFSDVYAIMLVNQMNLLNIFNEVMKSRPDRNPKLLWNVLMVQLLSVLNNNDMDVENCTIKSSTIAEVLDLLQHGVIDLETGKDILDLLLKGETATAKELVERNNWQLVCDPTVIEELCKEVVSRNPGAVKKYKKGKTKALQVIVNDVANVSPKKINLSMVSKRLKELLANN